MVDIGLKYDEQQKLVALLSSKPSVRKAVVYGSRAKGNYRRFSDIDLTLFGDELDSRELNRIAMDIDDLLLPYNVDLSLFSSLKNIALIEHIQRVGKTIYEAQRSFIGNKET